MPETEIKHISELVSWENIKIGYFNPCNILYYKHRLSLPRKKKSIKICIAKHEIILEC